MREDLRPSGRVYVPERRQRDIGERRRASLTVARSGALDVDRIVGSTSSLSGTMWRRLGGRDRWKGEDS